MKRPNVDSFLGLLQWKSIDFREDPLFRDDPGRMQCFWSINSQTRIGSLLSLGNWEVFVWGSIRDINEGGKVVHPENILNLLNSGIKLEKILQDKEGEFIIAAWDKGKRIGYLSVDPLGHAKLYYYVSKNGVYISSHTRLLSKYGPGDTICKEGLELLLSLRVIPSPFTIIDGVFKVSPGTIKIITEYNSGEIEYYSLIDENPKYIDIPFVEASNLLLEKLNNAIHRNLGENKSSNGLFLSGGLDSGLILALSSRQGYPLQNFTVGYNQKFSNDESYTAQLTAQAFNSPINVYKGTPGEVVELITNSVGLLPEPVGDISFFPQLLLAQQAAENVDIVLDGTGADNLFGGLNKTKAETYVIQYSNLPKFLRNEILPRTVNLLPTTRKTRLTGMTRKIKRFIEGNQLPFVDRQIYWTRLLHKKEINQILNPEWHLDMDVCNEILKKKYFSINTNSGLLASSYMSVKGVLPYSSLLKLTSVEYLTGLSIRLPYLAPDFVQFAFAIPDQYKVHGHEVKHILRRSAETAYPEKLRNRNTGNFTPPMRSWIKDEFREYFVNTLSREGPFDHQFLQDMIHNQYADKNDWLLELWVIFMFQSWMMSSSTKDLAVTFLPQELNRN